MRKNAFETLINDQLDVCSSVFNSNPNYEKYTKSFKLKNNTWIDFDFMSPTFNGSCWCITVLYDDGSYTRRRMFSVIVDVKNDGSNDLDIDSLYEKYKRISR